MTANDIHRAYKQTLNFLLDRKLKDAFDKMSELVEKLNSQQHRQRFEALLTHYKYMLVYFMDGTPDPERPSIHNKLTASAFELVSELRDELLSTESNNFEFTQKRYFPHKTHFSAEEISRKLEKDVLITELHKADVIDLQHEDQIQRDYETVSQYLFHYFWLKSTYDSPEILNIFTKTLSKENKDFVLQSLLVTALTLNLWRTFNEQKILMLFDACSTSDINAQQRAYVGLFFVLAKYNRFVPYFPKIRNRLVLLLDSNSACEHLKNIMLQIIATNETDEITKKLQEDIFPELMKLRPLMEKGLTDENILGIDEWGEINPEWQEMIESSGASDILQEFAELEMSGADVYMSTFSMLKSFPFFNEVSNWFLAFDTSNSHISPLFKDADNTLLATFANSNAMCNSDRYSFCLSIMQMPESQRGMMKHSFGDAAEQLEEANKDMALLEPNKKAEIISKHYIQDLFRFFKLYPKRSDFTNPFKTSLLVHKTQLFQQLDAEMDIKRLVSEFYFSKKLYVQAIELLVEIEKEGNANAEIYQKMGYAYHQTSQIYSALDAYKRADLIKPDDFWTNRKIALCYRLMGDGENALHAYRHADYINPGNLSVHLQIVNALASLERYEEALSELQKLNEQHSDNPKLIRATMKTAFAAKNIAQAGYFSSILLDSGIANTEDYILLGIISWVMNKNSAAKTHFIKALQSLDNNTEKFKQYFYAEKELAARNGVDENMMQLILDAVLFDIENNSPLI